MSGAAFYVWSRSRPNLAGARVGYGTSPCQKRVILILQHWFRNPCVEPEPDFFVGAVAGEKISVSGLLLCGLGVLWWQSSDNLTCKIIYFSFQSCIFYLNLWKQKNFLSGAGSWNRSRSRLNDQNHNNEHDFDVFTSVAVPRFWAAPAKLGLPRLQTKKGGSVSRYTKFVFLNS